MTPAQRAADTILAQRQSPLGVAIGAVRDGHRELAAAGLARSTGEAVAPGTRFDIASVSKVAATTSALHRLASLGQLRFDDPVERYLPGSGCAEGTRLRELMQHRAGLWEWQPLYMLDQDPFLTISQLPLRYAPGTERHYSDFGFMLLGRVVEAVAGQRLDAAVAELVFDPLGMAATGYGPVRGDIAASGPAETAEPRMVATGEPYPVIVPVRDFAWRDSELWGEVNDGNCFHALGGISGHAGIFSTVSDLLTLAGSFSRDDLWDPAVTAEVFADGPDEGQALGWRSLPVLLDGAPRRMLWHPGYTGCSLAFIPGEDVALAMLSNRLYAEGLIPHEALLAHAVTAVPGLALAGA